MPARVVLFALGGTIAMAGDAGVVPALSAAQLVAAVPGLADSGITVDVEDFRRVSGASLTFEDMAALSAAIEDRLDAGADGVVVTQGTDTIEETAYLLDLSHARPNPIVVTGAMRNPTLAGPDGPANLLAAVRTAASPTAADLGVLVVFADEIHAAARVRKTHSTSGATFRSPDSGPLGHVVEGTPRFLARPTHRSPLVRVDNPLPVEVPLVTMTLGDTGATLAAIAGQVDGLVIAGFGAGHVPARAVEALADLAARVPVVLASRTGAGPVLARTYGFPGSESDLLARGLIPAGFLDPLKARVLLHQSLAAGHGHTAVRAVFATSDPIEGQASSTPMSNAASVSRRE
ncbi:asparaginase [Actinokineospora iranica]|uniref:L-asparaginase n=1 Tax=Actinokineospora iranica TaxID=1271860 RepID=A0A1G6M2J9_9PSEU|nr:asparaginase [Actinokineospora iranica]SDC49205.1 L-asparaginase [Actinokineospora iranica]